MKEPISYLHYVIAILLVLLVIAVFNVANKIQGTNEQIKNLTSAQNDLASASSAAYALAKAESENNFLAKNPNARIFNLKRKSEQPLGCDKDCVSASLYTEEGNYQLDFVGDYATFDRSFFDKIEDYDQFSCFLPEGQTVNEYGFVKVNNCKEL